MAQPVTPIPVEHHPATYEIPASARTTSSPVTLFELIAAVSEVTDDEQEIVATVDWMLESGRVKLIQAPSRSRSESSLLQTLTALEDLESPARRLA